MSPSNLYWRDWHNAEIYNRYVHDFPIYRELNQRLIELAELAAARRVLDLACGAGATAQACLRRLPAGAELVGIDASEAMVALARAQTADPRARFEVATASTAGAVLSGTFDRAVCNAAYWQLASREAVLASLAELLEPGALFVFNVPAELVLGETTDVHAVQIALSRAIEARTDRSFASNPPLLDPPRLGERLGEAGFELTARERFVYRGRQRELVELMKIPAMIGPLTPELTPEARHDVMTLTEERTDPEAAVEVPWIYFVARRKAAP